MRTIKSAGNYESSRRSKLAVYIGYVAQNVEFSTRSVSVTSTARCILLQRGDSTQTRFYGKTLSLFMISELDQDAFPFSNLEEYLSSDDKGMENG